MTSYEEKKQKVDNVTGYVIYHSSDLNLHFHLGCSLRLITEVEQSRGLLFPLSVVVLDARVVFTSFLEAYTNFHYGNLLYREPMS